VAKILTVDDNTILPGTIGLVQISGEVGKLIGFGQWLETHAETFWFKREKNILTWEHAFVYLGNGKLIEAEPGGARIVDISEYDGVNVYWCTNIANQYHADNLQHVADIARGFEHVPYSFLDYFALVAHRLHISVPGLRRYIESTKHLICSQLADKAYELAGDHLFTDLRWAGDVSPLDIYYADQALIVKSLQLPSSY
jgi:hypothetical protein